MEYVIGLLVVVLLAITIGWTGSRLRVPVWLTATIGAVCGALIMYAISASQAGAVPVDVEAFKQPVKYRECRPLTWDDVQAGKDVLPLPPDCVMKPPAQRAEVSKHEAKPAVNPFAQFARY